MEALLDAIRRVTFLTTPVEYIVDALALEGKAKPYSFSLSSWLVPGQTRRFRINVERGWVCWACKYYMQVYHDRYISARVFVDDPTKPVYEAAELTNQQGSLPCPFLGRALFAESFRLGEFTNTHPTDNNHIIFYGRGNLVQEDAFREWIRPKIYDEIMRHFELRV